MKKIFNIIFVCCCIFAVGCEKEQIDPVYYAKVNTVYWEPQNNFTYYVWDRNIEWAGVSANEITIQNNGCANCGCPKYKITCYATCVLYKGETRYDVNFEMITYASVLPSSNDQLVFTYKDFKQTEYIEGMPAAQDILYSVTVDITLIPEC